MSKRLMIILAVALIAVAGIYFVMRPLGNENMKEITLTIVSERDSFNETKNYRTDKEFLGEFLIDKKLVEFQESQYGRYITAVKGMKSNDAEQYWWSIEVNGEPATLGMDQLVLEEGKTYSLTLRKGW